jgi:hypothetical protein
MTVKGKITHGGSTFGDGAAGTRPEMGTSCRDVTGGGEERPGRDRRQGGTTMQREQEVRTLLSLAAAHSQGRGERNEKPRVSTVGFSFLY